MHERSGFTLIEAIFAIFMGALLIAAAWMGLARQRQALGNMTRRAEALATVRMARSSLARDLSSAEAGSIAVGREAAFRALRAVALPCATGGPPLDPHELFVRYRGIRSPDTSKDSIRGLTVDGEWILTKLVDVVARHECDAAGGGVGLRLRVSREIQTLVYVELFESGSYHLTGRAIRYRGPGGNRQPLTPENVGSLSRFHLVRTRLELVLDSGGPAPWRMSLRPRELP